ncbi:glycosyl hydrolase family 18 protein [Jatrophihabitans sp. GAS493]|uniref:glycosyl hydrolase family 18 protein n=1 Tax=Jatrophihabitans sp. GAS493 TaxID=1907575 RepID=UPI001F5339D7|nr:glycosyl hydrolase family 18 protein [Jatrophihabitans sp. GAS493]
MQVVGYAEAGATTTAQLAASRGALTTVGVDGINLTSNGAGLTAVSTESLTLLRAAHAQQKKAELLIGNFDDAIGDFSPAIGHRLLESSAHIASVVNDLAADVKAQGWDGVTVDLESLTGKDTPGLTSFVSRLNSSLGTGKSVSICLMATPDGYAAEGYDLTGLGAAADHIVLMAYDQHGPTWSNAGPVGGQPWVIASLKPVLTSIPAAKVQLGIAGYGYTWPKSGAGSQLSDAGARAIVKQDGATPYWDATQLEWHATLSSGTVIWWSDARTYAARVTYARSVHLGGVAVWSLGLSDALR